MSGKFIFTVIFAAVVTVVCASPSDAREWSMVGPRALGMGGANVAVANDATASYWNPAAFGFFLDSEGGEYGRRGVSAVVDVGVGLQVHEDLGEQIDKISKIDFDRFNGGTLAASEVNDFIRIINDLKTFNDNPDRSVALMANSGLRMQAGHWGLGGYAFADVSAKGSIDLVNIGPVTTGTTFTLNDFTNPANYGCPGVCAGGTYLSAAQKTELQTFLTGLGWDATQRGNFINAVDYGLSQVPAASVPADIVAQIETVAAIGDAAAASGNSIDNNMSKLIFRGIGVAEIPLTYGRKITDDFALGVNFKYMKARVYNIELRIFNTDLGDALDNAKEEYVDSTAFGVDVGALYRFGDRLRLGVVARNVNSPEFDMKPLYTGGPDTIKEKAQVRAGIAFKPVDMLLFAVDMDLTENDTAVSDEYKSKNVAAGLELNLFNFLRLRGGAYKNLAENDIGLVYTAGLGLNLWLVNIDVGAAMSKDSSTVDGEDIPNEARVELALSMLF
ncbi:MAG: conjugal transfer protein TraF [Deltaproteobacteria bacterium]|nr:conjugal transfer protein TraF [Deltaproteobacteria bacterium]